jgi:hypothetical protein
MESCAERTTKAKPNYCLTIAYTGAVVGMKSAIFFGISITAVQ